MHARRDATCPSELSLERYALGELDRERERALKETLVVDAEAHHPDLAARADLERTLATLSLAELELFALAFRDGLTQDEIAELTRQSRKTVGKKLRALSERLRLSLDPPALAAEPAWSPARP